jgi:hypothetical protein
MYGIRLTGESLSGSKIFQTRMFWQPRSPMVALGIQASRDIRTSLCSNLEAALEQFRGRSCASCARGIGASLHGKIAGDLASERPKVAFDRV